ncbi:hypothetical protein GCM10011504_48120 [Siccirubricoccus deserti]|uniref:Sigma-70 family RNA polymerase sigma factor n=1 Tax=Siccirubricoccus deserti TaxID=2013562 RepID=A0A9X0R1Z6_9PROT|nr:sigma-70 family RNA polymerase sigma factor [Siccirubricoccus deserti]MBC4018246.1 sigma-70 family RNA polymerase sigma factor [Siccirubricoccus deserti]GGC64376.1 hypothetical protein GCM10011504_48120 [Siccirubricoccus deserti]
MACTAARSHAHRFARQRRLGRADREDLAQDILVAIVEAADRYDPSRAAWSTYVGLLAQHVVIDHARSMALRETVWLDASGADGIEHWLAADEPDHDLPLALRSAASDLPPAPMALLGLIFAHRDMVDARAASGVSAAGFYRALSDLRCWLRAAGLHPTPSRS